MEDTVIAGSRLPLDDFLKVVIRSGLLDRGQLHAAFSDAPPEHRQDPSAFADHLVRTGRLTRYQSRRLLDGSPTGLTLGPYVLLAPLGRGGTGAVYLVRDRRDRRLLALKVLPPKKARTSIHLVTRFRREMDLSRKVVHPNLAQTIDVGVEGGVHYIAMEFIAGPSLFRLVSDYGPLPAPRTARLFAQVAAALQHAHECGVIHRDLKPSNILVADNNHVKVLDLGLALLQNEMATDVLVVGGRGYVVGTMDYIAPEQTEDSSRVDGRADIYSMGCTMYFSLSGRPPFPGGSSARKIARHRLEEPVPLTQLNPDIPAEFAKLVHRMMAKRPDDRLPTSAAVRDALLPWMAAPRRLA